MTDMHLEQTYEKQLPAEVTDMLWSPKRDLIAFSLVSGGVALYRMTLHRVWTVDPPEEGATVNALCWRPDSALLAVAYSSGHLAYLELETGDVTHSETFPVPITCLCWAQLQDGSMQPTTNESDVDEEAGGDEEDTDEEFLPPLASLSRQYGSASRQTEEETHQTREATAQHALTVLAAGAEDGVVTLLLHGLLLFGRHSCGGGLAPRALAFAGDLSRLAVLADTPKLPQRPGALLQLELEVLSSSAEPLRRLATLHGRLSSHLAYLDRTIQAICEAWESVLVEMDAKMQRFQASLGERSSLSVEFLELLLLGVPSPEMEQFLVNDLTDSGLKKLRHSMELSYSNIQALVLRHLQAGALRVADLLIQMAGMARYKSRYGALGVCERRVNDAFQAAALFLMKAAEMQQVIDSSTRNFHAFFRWLYAVILRLSEASVPPDVAKMGPDDMSFIAQFIDTNLSSSEAGGVHLERVGMYLRDAELDLPPAETNSWRQFLEANPSLAASPLIVDPSVGRRRSLLQERDCLRTAVTALLADTAAAGSRTLHADDRLRRPLPAAEQCVISAQAAVLACRSPPCLYIQPVASPAAAPVELDVMKLLSALALCTAATTCSATPQLCEIAFCTDTILSALVTDNGPPVYLQIDLSSLLTGSASVEDVLQNPSAFAAGQQLENVSPVKLAVSGERHLLALLFKGGRRARVYDTADNDADESALDTTLASANTTMDENKENVAVRSP